LTPSHLQKKIKELFAFVVFILILILRQLEAPLSIHLVMVVQVVIGVVDVKEIVGIVGSVMVIGINTVRIVITTIRNFKI